MKPADQDIIDLLVSRDAVPTVVRLKDGRSLAVMNIAWGYDRGEAYAHVTTNMSPGISALEAELFFTSEVATILDPSNGNVLWQGLDSKGN